MAKKWYDNMKLSEIKDHDLIGIIADAFSDKMGDKEAQAIAKRLNKICNKLYEQWHMWRYGCSPGVYTG